jgi:cob(I)alamin adenosyltransferase
MRSKDVITKTGDGGTTDMLFGVRASKIDKIFDAIGDIDELNSLLGVIKTLVDDEDLMCFIAAYQNHLIAVMGWLSTREEDRERYMKRFGCIKVDEIKWLEDYAKHLDTEYEGGWSIPGGTTVSAYIDWARTIARRAERSCIRVNAGSDICTFMNRSSDLFWLLAQRFKACT